jgi:hypothetical protein
MKTFILASLLALTAVSGAVINSQPAAASIFCLSVINGKVVHVPCVQF